MSTIFSPKISTPKTPIHPNDNLAFLALQLIKKTYKIKKFVHITIKKNISIASGLGGASSDAAAVLKGLNKFWNLKISTKKLLALAAKLGMDVPFFVIGGTALTTHFGEKITPLPAIKNIKFKVFAKSAGRSLSKTASAYASLDLSLCGKNLAQTKILLKALSNKKLSKKSLRQILLANIHNDFATLSPQKNDRHLSGSGPSTFKII